jgi:hypothetical protein
MKLVHFPQAGAHNPLSQAGKKFFPNSGKRYDRENG